MSHNSTRKPTKGQGSLFRRSRSAYWQISYWNGWRQVRESAGTADRDQALQTLQQRLAEVTQRRGEGAGPERIKINALLTLLIEDYRRQDKADLYQAQLRIEKHLRPAFGDLTAAKLTSKHIREYIEKRKREAANATINRELAIVRRAYNLGTFEEPPLVYRVPRIAKLKEDNVREGFLEPEQYRAILEGLSDPVKPILVLGYHLGMRTGELLALKRDWIDLGEGLIYVNGRVTKNRKAKTAPIYGEMASWLELQVIRCKANSPTGKHLFIWEDGKQIRDFRGAWEKACGAAGLPELLFHDLRRTAVRNMIRAGVPEKVAMEVSGHKTASMLWRYNIVDARDIKEAGRRTERYLKEQSGGPKERETISKELNQ
jgi:integrase